MSYPPCYKGYKARRLSHVQLLFLATVLLLLAKAYVLRGHGPQSGVVRAAFTAADADDLQKMSDEHSDDDLAATDGD